MELKKEMMRNLKKHHLEMVDDKNLTKIFGYVVVEIKKP